MLYRCTLLLGNAILIVVVYIQCADEITKYGVFIETMLVLLGNKCDVVGRHS